MSKIKSVKIKINAVINIEDFEYSIDEIPAKISEKIVRIRAKLLEDKYPFDLHPAELTGAANALGVSVKKLIKNEEVDFKIPNGLLYDLDENQIEKCYNLIIEYMDKKLLKIKIHVIQYIK